jgi:hypothetical protein
VTLHHPIIRGVLAVPVFLMTCSSAAYAQQPVLSATANGSLVTVQWTPLAGAQAYDVEIGGAFSAAGTLPAFPTTYVVEAGPGTYLLRVRGRAGHLVGPFSEIVTVTVGAPSPPPPPPPGLGPRTPDPAPGTILPLPGYGPTVVNQVAAAYPGALRNSCGNNEWLFRLVYALRQIDTRWGLNWKRGVFGDMSQDVVTYNFASGADEGTTNVHIIDVISSHCGSNPGPAWQDVTGATRAAGTIGRWTLLPVLPYLPR